MRLRQRSLNRDGFSQLRHCLIELIFVLERESQVVVSRGVVGRERDQPLILGNRGCVVAFLNVRPSQIMAGDQIVGLQLERSIECRYRALWVALRDQRQAEIAVGLDEVWL
jgi:hypothetical protein